MEGRDELCLAALAGLLHDVGKLAQRAGWQERKEKHAAIGVRLLEARGPLAHIVPPVWWDDVGDAVAYHHGGDTHKAVTQAVRVADWLAASERSTGTHEKREPRETPLIPITSRLLPKGPSEQQGWGYALGSAVSGKVLFPERGSKVSEEDYGKAWDAFRKLAEAFPGPVDSFARMAGLLDLLAESMAYIPSATPWEKEENKRTTPDVSLYNHLHLTASIAACLMRLLPERLSDLHRAGWKGIQGEDVTIARLLKIDFSGIQDFIYCITEPADQRSFRNTAQRLRGRSFYLAALNRAIADWLAQRLDLPPTNVLYARGGVIELLLPPDERTKEKLNEAVQELSDGMWEEFHGDLGFVWAMIPMQPGDFADVHAVRLELERRISRAKGQKWHERLDRQDFFRRRELYNVCPVCKLSSGETTCNLCELHREIGRVLPHANALVCTPACPPENSGVRISFPSPIVDYLTLVDTEQQAALLRWAEREGQQALVRGVNAFPQRIERWPAESTPGFWAFANAAPIVERQVYDFEHIAELSQGAQLLGVLRADVDRMGLSFSHGLRPATFSRSNALSQTVSRFFGPYLNELAGELTEEWRHSLDDENREEHRDLQSLFYILYAGGDDLFVIGPWDQMVTFALRLNQRFKAYTCGNLTLSAGLIFVKPHFPIQHFARLAGEAEHAAKAAGRDRIRIFGRTLEWDQAQALVDMAQDWVEEDIPHGLIHDLGRMSRSHLATKDEEKPLFSPRLYYTLTRRLQRRDRKDREKMIKQVWHNLSDIVAPVSYASLRLRKE